MRSNVTLFRLRDDRAHPNVQVHVTLKLIKESPLLDSRNRETVGDALSSIDETSEERCHVRCVVCAPLYAIAHHASPARIACGES